MIRCAAGSLIWLAVWQFALRRGAGAGLWPGRNRLAAALDIAPALIGYAIALLALARPLLAGLVVAALAGGLTLIDQVKRIVLHEPVVFADRAELLEIARHPRLYLPFAGSAFVLGGAAAVIAALGRHRRLARAAALAPNRRRSHARDRRCRPDRRRRVPHYLRQSDPSEPRSPPLHHPPDANPRPGE